VSPNQSHACGPVRDELEEEEEEEEERLESEEKEVGSLEMV